jgi:hypothetical protein
MLTLDRVERLKSAIERYASEGCYQAAERQQYVLYEELIHEVATLKNQDLHMERIEHYRNLCRAALSE